jgi:hypothetical protein
MWSSEVISVTVVMMSIRRVFAFALTRRVNADIVVLVGGFVELVFVLLRPT